MRVYSFDVFDTLLCRDVAWPTDLHWLVGRVARDRGLISLSPEQYLRLRIACETETRAQVPDHEVRFEEIHAELAQRLRLKIEASDALQQLELRAEEQTLWPVPEMGPQVARARRQAEQILFLTDMYLPASFVESLLQRAGFFQTGDRLFVSSSERASKASGALFHRIREQIPGITEWIHCGDSTIGDVEIPRRYGLRIEPFRRAGLTPDEASARGDPEQFTLWRSRFAAAMRHARLAAPELGPVQRTIWDTGCNVVGPLFFGFAHWVVQSAWHQGIRRLYFISRDGQVLLKIAQIICHRWRIPMDCRYLYGSRQAWHPAAIEQLSEADLAWATASDAPLSLLNILPRLGLNPRELAESLGRAGFPEAEWDQPLRGPGEARLKEWLQQPEVGRIVQTNASRQRELLLRYLEDEGVLEGVPFALVDIGWSGNLQSSLGRVLRLAGHLHLERLRGFYFGLCRGLRQRGDQTVVDYWGLVEGPDGEIERQNISMFEIFAEADHGPVAGYQWQQGKVVPTFRYEVNKAALEWGLRELQDSVLQFAEQFTRLVQAEEVSPLEYRSVAQRLYERFYYRPSRAEAAAWGRFHMSVHEIDPPTGPLIPTLTLGQTLAAVRDYRKRPPTWWMEGSLKLHPNIFLRAFLWCRQARRWLDARIRPRHGGVSEADRAENAAADAAGAASRPARK